MVSNIVGNNKEFIQTGDLNCDLLSGTASRTKHLVQIDNTYHVQQIMKEATRTTSDTQTLIDHIVTDKPDKVEDSGVIPCAKKIKENKRKSLVMTSVVLDHVSSLL